MSSDTKKGTLLTCAQPTGKLHLGNYLGAVRHWEALMHDYNSFFGIVDLHAITMPYTPSELRKNTLDCVAQYIACGLNPEHCSIFIQSHIHQHAELAWLLSCLTPLGQLQRMTQFKDKSQKTTADSINTGLLTYPILQSADILLYNADIVPVGEDQKQHLELTRDLAEKFNHTYSETFTLPEPSIPTHAQRIMSLQNPDNKMSKSDPSEAGILYLWDDPATIRKKIGSSVTDSGSEIKASPDKPGITNLLTIMSAATGDPVAALESQFAGKGYGDFKAAVAESVISLLAPLQEKYHKIKDDKDALIQVITAGNQAASKQAMKTLSKVYRKAGFVERPR